MKALMSVTPGGPETLELQEIPTPTPGKGEVLIAIKAASVNFPDTLVIRDMYQFKPERPFAPGSEVAGLVEAVGDGVSNLKAGDNVFALLNSSGGFATHTVIDALRCVPLPAGMPHEEAAAFMMTYGTSHYALKDRGNLQAGESLFITGASGGVGSAAIELGKAAGARVIAGVSSEEKAAFCREIGADETIVYPSDLDKDGQRALSKEIKAKAGGEGVDVVYDAVGGLYAEPCVRALAWEGRFLVIGFPAGIPAVPLNLTLLKSCQIVGVFWGASVMRDPQGHAANMSELFALYQSGKIRPRITERFTLEEGAKALQLLEDRKATGKVVLTID
ncbi:NADPH:quinone oxidoreductase family protein [Parvularcula sp. IMCC14364]|uniref:NADPH:quinone oxidoreductase family protein n=1 Tax=Parvularcula sp. IMCC14364 TaxID=3067902 RepID=UPI0035571C18